MAFLDIEKVINREGIGSRFKLVHLAGLRAKELNKPREDTALQEMKEGEKVTSKALIDIFEQKVSFTEIIIPLDDLGVEIAPEAVVATPKKADAEKSE